MKKVLVGFAAFTAAMGASAGSVLAGEVNGRGESIPATERAASSCAFSGLQDAPFSHGGGNGANVQNYGRVEDDPEFVSINSSTGAAFVNATLVFGTFDIGCNPHAGGEG